VTDAITARRGESPVVDDDVEAEVFATELRATSFHEAGHCVAGWEYGLRCTFLRACAGHGLAEIPALGQAPAEVRLAVGVAGFLSARRFCYGVSLEGHTNSFDPSCEPAGRGGDAEVIENALAGLGEGAGTPEYRTRLYAVSELLGQRFQQVQELAVALAERGSLDERSLAGLVRRDGGCLKRYSRLYDSPGTIRAAAPPSKGDSPDLAGGRVRFFHPASERAPNGWFEEVARSALPRGAVRVLVAGRSAYCVPRGGRPAGRSR
jgi:hypothetical protein